MRNLKASLQQRLKELEQPENEAPLETVSRASKKQGFAQLLFELQDGAASVAQASAAASEATAMEIIKADSQQGRSKAGNKKKHDQVEADKRAVTDACLKAACEDLPYYQRRGGLKALRMKVSAETGIPLSRIERRTPSLKAELYKLK